VNSTATPNQALERTATRRAFTFNMNNTVSFQATRAPAAVAQLGLVRL
jgi:hypothetical protein